MKQLTLLLLLMLTAAGCSSSTPNFTKPDDMTSARFAQDKFECRKKSEKPGGTFSSGIVQTTIYDAELYQYCMESKSYHN